MAGAKKRVVVIAGPNGAGKTTFAKENLKELDIDELVNADEIAHGLNPLNPSGQAIAAGRFMLKRLQTLSNGDRNFAFETTCAGRTYIRFLNIARAHRFTITIVYLWLRSPEMARIRVERRVKAGGHDVDPAAIARRFDRGLKNFHDLYMTLAAEASEISVLDNSDGVEIADSLIASRPLNSVLTVHSEVKWRSIVERVNTLRRQVPNSWIE